MLERFLRRLPDVQWVRPEQIHLTLHFFGATPAGDVDTIDKAMSCVAARFTPLTACLEQLGGFPDLTRPNVIWVGVRETTGELFSLQNVVREELSRLGFPVERRPFRAHVTLGRVKKRITDLGTIIGKPGFKFPTTAHTLDHFNLYQSHCLPDGARYEILRTYALSKT